MSPFRGDDETLDREISTLEGMAKRRLKRYTNDLRDLDRDLSDLRKERARRRARSAIPMGEAVSESTDPVRDVA